MGFWIFMLIMDMLLPLTMLGFGKLFLENSPGEINAVFGYRTSMSMKNRDTWEFAHKYCGNLWYRLGLILLPVSAAAIFLVRGKGEGTVGMVGGVICGVQLIFLIGSIYPTERALRRNFDRDGNRR